MVSRPTAEEMAGRIRAAIRRDGEAAVPEILAAVADTMLAIDYPVPIERCMGTERDYGAALVESMAHWFRDVLADGGSEHRPAAGPGRPALTLYVWEGVLTDHTDGVMFALARDADEARRLIREAFDYVPGDDLARTPEAVAGPKAFVKWGGG